MVGGMNKIGEREGQAIVAPNFKCKYDGSSTTTQDEEANGDSHTHN